MDIATDHNGYGANDPRRQHPAGVATPDPFGWMKLAQQVVTTTWQPLIEAKTRNDVEAWIALDKADIKSKKAKAAREGEEYKSDGSSVAGRYYTHMKKELQGDLAKMLPATRELTEGVLNNLQVQEWMRSEAMAKQFELIDEVIREQYPNEHGVLFEPQYNHKFLTETSHSPDKAGKIQTMDVDAIVKLFKDKKPEEFPRLIITSSHAQGETLKDVSVITHGIEALARDSQIDAQNPKGVELNHGFVDKGVKAGQTLTIYACDVRESPWLNGAALLRRINELKRIAKTGEPDREFRGASNGAKRIAKLMLKCMVEEPDAINVDSPHFTAALQGTRAKPIVLRPDAVEIANHFQLIGYSKGGNVVSDAMRYLVYELTSKRADGKSDLFAVNPKSPDVAGDDHSMNQQNVRNVVRGISCLALAAVETAMSDFDKAHGVRRVSVNSEQDLISAHHNFKGTKDDERQMVQGVDKDLGHHPTDMLGSRYQNEAERLDEEFHRRGFAHDDPRVSRRLKELFAPLYNNAAIAHVRFNGEANTGEVMIEIAAGTTPRMMTQARPEQGGRSFLDTIQGAVATSFRGAAMFKGVTLEPVKGRPDELRLHCDGIDFTKNIDAMNRLNRAFQHLRKPEQKGLAIAQTMIDEDIGGRLKEMSNAQGR